MKSYKLWQNAQKKPDDPCASSPIEIQLPDYWNIEFHTTPGDSYAPLGEKDTEAAVQNPIDLPALREFANGGKEVCIVFDDLSRPTPTAMMARVVLRELHSLGYTKDHIRFVCALGSHGAMSRDQMALKIGDDVLENYRVFNHNAFYHHTCIGKDYSGKDVYLNKQLLDCDVRIGLGSVCPHPMNGYGGGGKLLLPGMASIDTILSNHTRPGLAPMGEKHTCRMRQEIDDITSRIEPFFSIQAVMNSKLDMIGVFAGTLVGARNKAMELSSVANCLTKKANERKDVVIVNANAKTNETNTVMNLVGHVLKKGGDIVIINFNPYGHVIHYLSGPFGTSNTPLRPDWPERPKANWGRLIFYTPYPEASIKYNFQNPEKVVFSRTWNGVLDLLSNRGAGTEVSVMCEGTNTYFPLTNREV